MPEDTACCPLLPATAVVTPERLGLRPKPSLRLWCNTGSRAFFGSLVSLCLLVTAFLFHANNDVNADNARARPSQCILPSSVRNWIGLCCGLELLSAACVRSRAPLPGSGLMDGQRPRRRTTGRKALAFVLGFSQCGNEPGRQGGGTQDASAASFWCDRVLVERADVAPSTAQRSFVAGSSLCEVQRSELPPAAARCAEWTRMAGTRRKRNLQADRDSPQPRPVSHVALAPMASCSQTKARLNVAVGRQLRPSEPASLALTPRRWPPRGPRWAMSCR
jgi:hypothetical protein